MIERTAKSYTVKIWIAGDYHDAVRAVREFCASGNCFAIAPVDYVYTGGLEAGVCVTRINYPRFSTSEKQIYKQCLLLAKHLQSRLFQESYSIETPTETTWFSLRGADD